MSRNAHASTSLRAGFARADITPGESIRMAGYAVRKVPSKGIADRLNAKAMAVANPHEEPALLLTADLIGFDRLFAEAICNDIARETGIGIDRIILNASHTHGGPVFGIRYAKIYTLPPAEAAPVAAYTKRLRRQLTALAVEAVKDLKTARLSWGTGICSFGVTRRVYTPDGFISGANPRGYVDRSVPVLRVEGADGALRGVLFGYACHNTTLTGTNFRITADYAGYAQRFIERRHPGAQAMFVQSFGADTNPSPRTTFAHARRYGQMLGKEVCRLLEGELAPVRGPHRALYGSVKLPMEPRPPQSEIDQMRLQGDYYCRMADRIEAQTHWPKHYPSSISAWEFGDDLTLVALPGEVVADYAPLVERVLRPRTAIWLAGYCNDYFGYLPSARVHAEGGYEGHDYITGFGYLASDVESVILRKVKQLAQQAGRR